MTRYDIVSLGEPLLRFSPPRDQRIDYADSFDVRLAGSQMNIAADAARLGLRSALLTRLPANPLGELARRRIAEFGVDVSLIEMAPGSRMGTTFVEFSTFPRMARSMYDRAGSAASGITPATFDWEAVAGESRIFYSDGIFPALSPECAAASEAFFRAGRRRGVKNAFDLNFRRQLWSAAEACKCWSGLLPLADIAVINRNVCEEVFGLSGDDRELCEKFSSLFGCGWIAFTSRTGEGKRHGAWQALLMHDGGFVSGEAEFDIVDRYGSGDAWLAGLLYSILAGKTPEDAVRFANAVLALAHTTFGDVIQCSAEEAETMASEGPRQILYR